MPLSQLRPRAQHHAPKARKRASRSSRASSSAIHKPAKRWPYLRSHPTETLTGHDFEALRGGPAVSFQVQFPAPGLHRIWTQVQRGETVSTATFTVEVPAG